MAALGGETWLGQDSPSVAHQLVLSRNARTARRGGCRAQAQSDPPADGRRLAPAQRSHTAMAKVHAEQVRVVTAVVSVSLARAGQLSSCDGHHVGCALHARDTTQMHAQLKRMGLTEIYLRFGDTDNVRAWGAVHVGREQRRRVQSAQSVEQYLYYLPERDVRAPPPLPRHVCAWPTRRDTDSDELPESPAL
jgi:hypothetical protein